MRNGFFFFLPKKKIIQQMNATHPFLDKAYLWFSPGTFFFADKLPDTRLSLRWERSSRIRRIAPISRIIDPDSSVPPKKVPVSPLYLPSMRTIVRALCPNKLQLAGPVPPPPAPSVGPVLQFDHEEAGGGDDDVVASTSGVRVEDLREKFPMEEIILGDDVEIDWDWWGSSTSNPVRCLLRLCSDRFGAAADGEAEDEATVVGSTQPQPSSFTPAPPPITPSRYHPCRSIALSSRTAVSHGGPRSAHFTAKDSIQRIRIGSYAVQEIQTTSSIRERHAQPKYLAECPT